MTASVRKSVRNMDHVVDHMQEPLTKYLDRVDARRAELSGHDRGHSLGSPPRGRRGE